MKICKIATAGWAIPRLVTDQFGSEGSGLARYADRFDGVEINTTFYRSHRADTYQRWLASTPPRFRFAVKLPKAITHEARLVCSRQLIATFQSEAEALEPKLGPLLIQLPPSLVFDADVTERFFSDLREVWRGTVVCEPRHLSWFESDPDLCLQRYQIGRVAADPACCSAAASPGGWNGISYWRLHGSPRKYFSSYEDPALRLLGTAMQTITSPEIWCVFDNTASGAATGDALRLQTMITGSGYPARLR